MTRDEKLKMWNTVAKVAQTVVILGVVSALLYVFFIK